MALKVTKVDVWAGEIADQPGGLSRVLEPLAAAGANIECLIARRQGEKPGTGVAFVAPVKAKKVQNAATAAGLARAENISTLRVEGPDKPGLGARMSDAIADAGVNVRGVSAMVLGNKFVAYIGLDSAEDAAKATKAIKSADAPKKRGR